LRGGIGIVLLAVLPLAAAAEESPLGLSYVETKDVRLVYFEQLDFLVPHAVRSFTNSLAFQRRMFGWTPSESTTVLLKDLADYGNALVWSAPRNTLFIDVAPHSHAFETYPASERLYSWMNHELVHVMEGDIGSDDERRWRRWLLGKVAPDRDHPESLLWSYLTVPRFVAPRWFHEGSAVFMETFMGGGVGRAQAGYDEMVFRAMVRDGAHIYDPLGLESRGVRVDFQVTSNAYLYGTRFITWLAYAHSPSKVVAWLRRDEGSRRNYADQFAHVFGVPLDDAWRDWLAFERDFQQRNLSRLREHPITPQRRLFAGPAGSVSRVHYDEANGKLYGAFRYQGIVEHVGAVDTRDGTVRRLADIKRAMLYRVASFAFDAQTGTAFYTNDNLALRDLMAVDARTGESRMLIEDARIGEIAFNRADRSLLGIRHDRGIATLVRIPYPYAIWEPVHVFDYGVVPYDLDVSADGRLLSASIGEVNADQYVRVWELDKALAGDMRPLSEFRFGQAIPESFVFSPDARYLYGSSYYTGVSNIFRYEVATGEVEAVSNADIGFFRPVPLADGNLLVLSYTAEGFVPAIIEPRPLKDVSAIVFLGTELAERHAEIKQWQVPPPSSVDYDRQVTASGAYRPLRNVGLQNAYPVLQGYKDEIGVGWHFTFEDPIRFALAGATVAITPGSEGDEVAHFDVWGRYLGWRASLAWNKSDFYDLFGPTKRSRKGLAIKGGYDWTLIFDEPRQLDVIFDVAYYDKIDTLPNAQNVGTTFERMITGEVGLRYTDVRRSLGAVDDEKGIAYGVKLKVSRVEDDNVPQLWGRFDYGWDLPLGHSSIWLRTAAGAAKANGQEDVARFYFGGFGNNYVDSGPEKRYRERESLPGFEIDEVSGLNFVRAMVEWNIPPLVLESAGFPAFHAAWLRPAVFATALVTDLDDSTQRTNYASVGAQIDVRFSTLHWYDLTLSIGYGVGFREGRRAGSEWMVSLKIL
jgi:hypothetical protein